MNSHSTTVQNQRIKIKRYFLYLFASIMCIDHPPTIHNANKTKENKKKKTKNHNTMKHTLETRHMKKPGNNSTRIQYNTHSIKTGVSVLWWIHNRFPRLILLVRFICELLLFIFSTHNHHLLYSHWIVTFWFLSLVSIYLQYNTLNGGEHYWYRYILSIHLIQFQENRK